MSGGFFDSFFNSLFDKYSLKINGVLYLGAHELQELKFFHSHSVENIIWVEGNDVIVERMRIQYPNQIIINALLSDKVETVNFMISTHDQSSSILNFKTHRLMYPLIYESHRITKTTTTIKDLIKDYPQYDWKSLNFVTLDLQGVELRVLREFGEYLDNFDYIHTEVNIEELYEDCDRLGDVDSFLDSKGFMRVELKMTEYGWGDAFYIRKTKY